MKYLITFITLLLSLSIFAQVDSTFRQNQSWAWVTEDHPDSLVPPLEIAGEGDLVGPELIYNKTTGNLWVFNPEDSLFVGVQLIPSDSVTNLVAPQFNPNTSSERGANDISFFLSVGAILLSAFTLFSVYKLNK